MQVTAYPNYAVDKPWTRFNPTIAGKAAVVNGSAFGVSGGSGARSVAPGKRVLISRRKPSSVSTLTAAILAISALSRPAGLLAISRMSWSACYARPWSLSVHMQSGCTR